MPPLCVYLIRVVWERADLVDDALYARWSSKARPAPMMGRLDYAAIQDDIVRQIAKVMTASAITATKSDDQLFQAGHRGSSFAIVCSRQASASELADGISRNPARGRARPGHRRRGRH